MYKIYHNPRCRKSREGLQILEDNNVDFETHLYLKETLDASEIKSLLKKLNIEPINLVRTNEAIWKEQFKAKDLNDEQIVEALAKYPKLIERPIVTKDNKAVIGRPPSNIEEFIND